MYHTTAFVQGKMAGIKSFHCYNALPEDTKVVNSSLTVRVAKGNTEKGPTISIGATKVIHL